MKSKQRTEADAALKDILTRRAQWRGALDATEAEVRAAESVNVDPSEAADVAARITTARTRVELARRMLGNVENEEREARRALVRIAADEMSPAIEKATKKLDEHEAKVNELLAALEEFSGGDYRPLTEEQARLEQLGTTEPVGRYTMRVPVAKGLRQEVARLERQRDMLLYAADGGDVRDRWPNVGYDELPPELQSCGVLEVPSFVASRVRAQGQLIQGKNELAEAEERVKRAQHVVERARYAVELGKAKDDEQIKARGLAPDWKSEQLAPLVMLKDAERGLAEAEAARDNAKAWVEERERAAQVN